MLFAVFLDGKIYETAQKRFSLVLFHSQFVNVVRSIAQGRQSHRVKESEGMCVCLFMSFV